MRELLLIFLQFAVILHSLSVVADEFQNMVSIDTVFRRDQV